MDIWVTARKFVHVSIWQVVILLINLFSMISFFPVGVFITAVEALVDTWKNSEWQNMFFPPCFFSKHPNASPSFTSKSKCFCVFFVSTDYSLSTTRIPILSWQFNISSHKRRQKWSFELEGNPHQLDALGLTGIQEAGSSPHVRSWLGWTRFVACGWIRNQIGRMSFQQILFWVLQF